jgi:hypothetical protein
MINHGDMEITEKKKRENLLTTDAHSFTQIRNGLQFICLNLCASVVPFSVVARRKL